MIYGLLLRIFVRLLLIFSIVFGLYEMHVSAFGMFQAWPFLFYTNLSNLAVLLVILLLCAQDFVLLFKRKTLLTESQNQSIQQLKIALTWAISITGIVWHLVLVPAIEQHLKNPQTVSQFIPYIATINIKALFSSLTYLHTYAPLLAFADWLLFNPKGTIRGTTPIKWLLIPAGYFLFICTWVHIVAPVNSQFNLTYPYGFIDFTENSAWVVWRNVALTGIFALSLGYLYFMLDKLLRCLSARLTIR